LRSVLLTLMFARSIAAGLITATVPQYDGPVIGPAGPYPQPAVTVGTFTYTIPLGESILSASIAGAFGDFDGEFLNSTAPVTLHAAGETVATCTTADPCFTTPLIPWTFTFSASDFAQLATGSVPFTQVQTGPFQVHLSQTTLSIITAPIGAPEPRTLVLIGAAVVIFVVTRLMIGHGGQNIPPAGHGKRR